MDYKEALDYLYSLRRFGIKPGVRRIKMLLELLGNPQDSLNVVHVAGTNGKGSTVAFISSILKEAGYRVGTYISPHLIDFTERMTINGLQIKEEVVVMRF
ncbi:hypothetical protein [Kosmotoga sp. DU53]|uniref:hypothetical protein n=1 Tax=Kosmotoga sp. DU53 TaxID=1310160 RepID=UPI0007C46242|nr:hypothetical protein [Kosmotoga sp. DU53]OAA23401.1 hypothetical protein DU53_02705 [Kosmotoga sp. DU53]